MVVTPVTPLLGRHFLTCMGWSDSTHPHTLFDAYLWSVSFCGQGLASERHFLAFFLCHFLGYHCYHRQLGHFFFPNLVMAGSWGGYLIAFTAWRVDTGGFGFWLKKDAAMQPNLGGDRDRDTPSVFFFFFFPPFLGWIPVGTGLRRLAIMIPLACVSEDTWRPLFCFPFTLFSCLMDNVYVRPSRRIQPRPNCDDASTNRACLVQLDVGRHRPTNRTRHALLGQFATKRCGTTRRDWVSMTR
jgi:hypothetical protein